MVSLLLAGLVWAQEAPPAAEPSVEEAQPIEVSEDEGAEVEEAWQAAGATPTAPAPEGPAPLLHVPVVEAPPDRPLPVSFSCEDLRGLGQVELMYRPLNGSTWRSLGFGRLPEGGWVAVIPAEDMAPPGVAYYIRSASGPRGGERFASERAPQVVRVESPPARAHKAVELERFDGHKSRFSASGWYVNFGAQDELVDRWYGGDFDFTYRVLGAVRTVRFGVSRMWATGIFDGLDGVYNDETGLAHGFAELEFQPIDALGITTQVQLGANATSFTAGGRGALRIGPEPGTHVELYGGGTGGLGVYGGMMLNWDTVPKVPMAAGLEVTNWPTAGDDWAVRLLYDMEVPLGEHADLLLGANYQARASDYGSFGGRGGIAWSF